MKKLPKNHDSTLYKNLNLVSNFLFQHVMERDNLAPRFLEYFLKRKIENLRYVFSELVQSVSLSSKDTRFDILLVDDNNHFYDIEMENRNLGNLGPRADYYANIIGVKNLKVGADYDELPYRTIIFITSFDPFGKNRCVYTFKDLCEEDPDIRLDTRREIIFLNLKGTVGLEDLAPEIRDFMKIAVKTTKEVADSLETSFGRNIYKISEEVKNDTKLEDKFMGMYSNYQHDMKEQHKKGILDTLEVQKMYKDGHTKEDIVAETGISLENVTRMVEVLV